MVLERKDMILKRKVMISKRKRMAGFANRPLPRKREEWF
jgi:hypothetical protein